MRSPRPDEKFWMIARLPTSTWAEPKPRKMYRNRADAEFQAEVLARRTGDAFVILAVEEVVHPAARSAQPGLL